MFAAMGPQTFHGGKELQPSRRPWGRVAMTGDLWGFSWEEMMKDVFRNLNNDLVHSNNPKTAAELKYNR